MTDPLSDMLTRIRNGQKIFAKTVQVPGSKFLQNVLQVLKREGYIQEFSVSQIRPGIVNLEVSLKYYGNKAVIQSIQRVSKPSRRIYAKIKDLPLIYGGLGIAVLSTSKGVLSDREARNLNIGGEVLCQVF